MPSPKSGKTGSAVTPTEPQDPQEADKADPGEVDQVKGEKAQTKNSSAKTKPYKPDPEKKSWIEIVLVDKSGKPVPGVKYQIILPDGESVAEGTLNEKGFARVNGIDTGTCQVTFPEMDGRSWEKA